MYVRWQLYRSRALKYRQREPKRARLRAVLVECVRIDGKPRQKHIASLGTTSIDGSDRPHFWYEATTRLNRLGNRISRRDRDRIGAAIASKVGGRLLTKTDIAKWERSG